VLTINAHPDGVTIMRWSPDSAFLATGGEDATLVIWDATSGAPLVQLDTLGGAVTSLAWSTDSSLIVAAAEPADNDAEAYPLRIWNVASGTLQSTLTGPAASVTSSSWSTDGLQIAAGDRDGMLFLWPMPENTNPSP
jgi:WD40 repeat protein